MRFGLFASLAVAVALAPAPVLAKSSASDAQIRQILIRQSIANYPGNCPCPYNAARNGSSCGGRSAWSRRGGYAPLCYASDVSKSAVQAWRAAH